MGVRTWIAPLPIVRTSDENRKSREKKEEENSPHGRWREGKRRSLGLSMARCRESSFRHALSSLLLLLLPFYACLLHLSCSFFGICFSSSALFALPRRGGRHAPAPSHTKPKSRQPTFLVLSFFFLLLLFRSERRKKEIKRNSTLPPLALAGWSLSASDRMPNEKKKEQTTPRFLYLSFFLVLARK